MNNGKSYQLKQTGQNNLLTNNYLADISIEDNAFDGSF
jgi:hypothetical protein